MVSTMNYLLCTVAAFGRYLLWKQVVGRDLPRPTEATGYPSSIRRVPTAPAIVITGTVRMPIARSVVIPFSVVSLRTNSEEYAEAVAVMFAFGFSGLSGARAEHC